MSPFWFFLENLSSRGRSLPGETNLGWRIGDILQLGPSLGKSHRKWFVNLDPSERSAMAQRLQSFAPAAHRFIRQFSSNNKRRFSFKTAVDEEDSSSSTSSGSPLSSPGATDNNQALLFHVEHQGPERERRNEHSEAADRDLRSRSIDPERGLETEALGSRNVSWERAGAFADSPRGAPRGLDPEMEAVRNGCNSSSRDSGLRGSSQEFPRCLHADSKSAAEEQLESLISRKSWDSPCTILDHLPKKVGNCTSRKVVSQLKISTRKDLVAFAKAVIIPISFFSAIALQQLMSLDGDGMTQSQWVFLVISLTGALTAGLIATIYAIAFTVADSSEEDAKIGTPAHDNLLEIGSSISIGLYMCVVLIYVSIMILLSVRSPHKGFVYRLANCVAVSVWYMAVQGPLNKVLVDAPYVGWRKQIASVSSALLIALVGTCVISGYL